MAMRGPARRSMGVALAAVLLLTLAPIAAGTGGHGRQTAGTDVVTGEAFDPMTLRSGGPLSARARANGRFVAGKVGTHPGNAPTSGATIEKVRRAPDPATSSSGTGGVVSSVTSGLSLLHTLPELSSQWDATGGMVGGKVVYGTPDRIYADPHLPTDRHITNWENADFFDLPSNHWYWGATVSSSIYRGRWVAALPSFVGPGGGCTTGYMNIAVSTSTDPLKPWLRYRLSIGDAWSDAIRLGVSDNKIVLATNRWDLNSSQPDCLGDPYEGAKLRVVDWDDLLDGGTLTSKDVSPASSTNYFNFVPATNVPTTTSTTSGGTLYLAGEKLAGTWGHVVFATITGSAKSGSAALVRNEDLTAAGTVSLLSTPPPTIAAFSSGNGLFDQRILSATYRSGRLWMSSTGSCKVPEDAEFRACARYIHLNTSVTPATNLESVNMVELERDTFLPLVGFARDGGTYFAMAASSAVAHEPIDELATYRAAGQPLVGGDLEVPIWEGEQTFELEYFGGTGSIIAVPNDSRAVLAVYTASAEQLQSVPWVTQLRGGQIGNPGGSFWKVHNGTGFKANASGVGAVLRPLPTSPIKALRYSAAPDVESTAGGPRLVLGIDLPPMARFSGNFDDPAIGGAPDPSSITMYVQWQTWDGTWSTPISASVVIDDVAPTVSQPWIAFTTGTIGPNVPVKTSWTASDALSGLAGFVYIEDRQEPTSAHYAANVSATTRSVTRTLALGGSTYQYAISVSGTDVAGNGYQAPGFSVSFSSVPSSSNMSFVKTWSTSTSSSYLGGSTRYASTAGATVTYAFTGRAIGFVSTKGPSRGKAEVWIDGVKRATIDLYSATTRYRQLAFQTSWTSIGAHTIMVKVLGTSGRPRVDFDTFLKAWEVDN